MLSFGDITRALFGGSKQTQASSTQATSTPLDLTPQAFTDLRNPFASQLSQFSQTGGPQYDGPLFSPETGNEQAVRGQLMGSTGPNTARSGYLNDVIGGKYLDPNSNPFLNDYIKMAQNRTFQGLEETLSRALPGRFTQAGQFIQGNMNGQGGSSAFDRAGAIATRAAAQTASDIATGIGTQAYEGERNRQQQAVQLDQAEVESTFKNLQAQALPRLIQEMGIERGLALHQQNVNSVLQVLQMLGAVTQPHLAQTSQSTGTSYGEGTSYKGMFSVGGGSPAGGAPVPA